MELRKTFRFEASHVLKNHKGKCSRLHGHSWVLHVHVEGKQSGPNQFVQDYAEISDIIKPIIEQLDHRHLGPEKIVFDSCWYFVVPSFWIPTGIPPDFYPCSENILWWIAEKINGELPLWSKVALEETCTSYASLTRQEYDDREERRLKIQSLGGGV